MNSVSRRDFLWFSSAVLLRAALPVPASTTVSFSFGDHEAPILATGESVIASETIRELSFFTPFFDPGRPQVNPCEPQISGRRITFTRPGEYYLRINGTGYLKAVVFEPSAGVLTAVLHLFDSFVANNIYLGAEDHLFQRDRLAFVRHFFTSPDPMLLPFSPTHQVFRRVVGNRFLLPTRICSGAGAFWLEGKLVVLGHNVPEVCIPGMRKFIFLDLNNGTVPKWLDGIELAETVRKLPGESPASGETLDDLAVDFYIGPTTRHASSRGVELVATLGEEGLVTPRDAIVSDRVVTSEARMRSLRSFNSGAMYWGNHATMVHPCGTEFLEGWVQLGAQVKGALASATRKNVMEIPYVESVDWLKPAILRARLHDGHRQIIEAQAWQKVFAPGPA